MRRVPATDEGAFVRDDGRHKNFFYQTEEKCCVALDSECRDD